VKRDANGKKVLSGYITLSGAFALYPLAIQWADEFHRLHPDVDIDISAGGAGKGITDVLADQVDIAMVSRELKLQEKEKGALAYAVAKDAVVATIHANNPVYRELLKTGLSQKQAKAIWEGKTKMNVYTRSDACGAAETWAAFLGKKQEDLKGTGVFGDPGVAETLQKDVNGIGFNNIGYAYDDKTHKPTKGIAIVPIDVNGNGKLDEDEKFYDTLDELMGAIAQGKYPTPPARNLYLVTAGKPKNPVVVEFLKYVRTKGQRLNGPAGFVHI
jgi:putative phosphate-binding protein